MKGLKRVGDYLFEYTVISLLLILSFALMVPFVPVYIGIVGYFKRKTDDRMFRDIFVAIKENFRIIAVFTIFELLLLMFSGLNIYFFNSNPEEMNGVMLFISYIGFLLGLAFMVFAPVIILHMNVTFVQLLGNSLQIILGQIANSFYLVVFIALYLIVGVKIPYLLILLLYFIPLAVSKMTYKNFLILKALKLHTTVAELIKEENCDDYLDEYGYINREQ